MSSKLTPPINEADHEEGNATALITLVEYGDYQCPHCGAAHPIVKQLQKAFGIDLRLVFRNFPLQESHPQAVLAAAAAEAAGKQGKFWQMHDLIFEHQQLLPQHPFIGFAEQLGLNIEQFEDDVESTEVFDKVEGDFESGVRSGVNGTPSFYINGAKYNGSYDYESMHKAISTTLSVAK